MEKQDKQEKTIAEALGFKPSPENETYNIPGEVAFAIITDRPMFVNQLISHFKEGRAALLPREQQIDTLRLVRDLLSDRIVIKEQVVALTDRMHDVLSRNDQVLRLLNRSQADILGGKEPAWIQARHRASQRKDAAYLDMDGGEVGLVQEICHDLVDKAMRLERDENIQAAMDVTGNSEGVLSAARECREKEAALRKLLTLVETLAK